MEDDIDRLEEHMVPSPFDFERQALVAIPTDLPSAGGSDPAFHEATVDVLESFSSITQGGLFGLFTSYGALRRVAQRLRDRGLDARWPLLIGS